MTGAHDEEFRRLFLVEAEEQLDRLADTVIELERRGSGAELVATLFRDAHTLKSSGALVGLPTVSEVAHGLEDLLGELRAGTRPMSPGLADGVLDVVDALRGLIDAGLAGTPAEGHLAAARAGLLRAAAAEPAGAEPAAASPPVTYQDATFRQLFADEVIPELERLTGTALELERRGPEPQLVAALFRGAHSLKGSAAVVGFDEVAELAHRLEDRLDELRTGRRAATPAFVDAVLAVLDAVRTATPDLVAGHAAAPLLAAGRAALEALDGAPATPALAPGLVRPPAIAPRTAAVGPPVAAPRTAPTAPVGAPAAAPGAVALEREPARAAVTLAEPPAAAPRPQPADGDRLVPVGLDRLDGLVRLSGEAVAAGLRLSHLLREHIEGDAAAEAAELELRRVLAGVQQQTMRTRMTTLEGIAGNLRRAVRDVARAAGKEVDYELEGERVELDRAVLDGLRDPLLHLVRNAVDHGLETPDARVAAGKPRAGTVRVVAGRRGPEIAVSVTDDGSGLDLDGLRATAGAPDLDDREAADLVFRAGLSTAGTVTDISGRGVGLDAVRTAVEGLRGRVDVSSRPGQGCTFTVTVPLTLAVVPCVLLRAGGQRYHLPAHATRKILRGGREAEVGLEGGTAVWVGGDAVPVSDLAAALGGPGATEAGPVLVLEAANGRRHAFRVDAVLGQRDVTVKELGAVAPRSQLVAGASIEADGSVVLVLDPSSLVEVADRRRRGAAHGTPAPAPAAAPTALARILVVDDALTVRELERSILERAGYAVRVAVDGEDALARLAEERPDLVITDVEMPRRDGHGLAAAIRANPALSSLPVLMVTSRASDEDRRKGLEAGADAYIVKQDFDAERLLEAVTRLLGG